MNIAADGEQKAAWCAQENDENQWLQVDCGGMVLVTRVAVQGRGDEANWVTSYTLSYSHNGEEFLVYEENGEAKVFKCEHMHQFDLLCIAILPHKVTAMVTRQA